MISGMEFAERDVNPGKGEEPSALVCEAYKRLADPGQSQTTESQTAADIDEVFGSLTLSDCGSGPAGVESAQSLRSAKQLMDRAAVASNANQPTRDTCWALESPYRYAIFGLSTLASPVLTALYLGPDLISLELWRKPATQSLLVAACQGMR
jgi:hypothetical protein